MFDILKCRAEPSSHRYSRFFFSDEVKGRIAGADNLKDAVQFKNKKTLILLKDHAFDEGAIKTIAEKEKACFLIDLGAVIKTRGVPRAILLSKLRTFLAMCIRHGAYVTFASFAENEDQIRSPSELCHITMLLGLNRGQAKSAQKMLASYL